MNLFGWQIRRAPIDHESFAPPQNDDGATIVQPAIVGGSYGTYLDLDNSARTEAELVTKYRTMALAPEIRQAVDHVVNEAIVVQKETPIVELDLNMLPNLPDPVKQAIKVEFQEILRLLEFKTKAYDIFRTWYVDGRLYYHAIVDRQALNRGVLELRWLDPRKMKKVKEVEAKKVSQGQQSITVQKTKNEYFIYNERGFDAKASPTQQAAGVGGTETGVRIAKDAIAHVTSGILDESGKIVYGYLHDAIRPFNMFRTVSDSAVIYRLVRAPQRRVFYIDVGDLPKHKAEQYVNDMMTKYKNKLVFDPLTGAMKDERKHMTMLEDFWLSRREGGRGTQIETLDGAANWGVMEEVEFFLKLLYKSLHVPLGRLDQLYVQPFGRAGEISREEVDFTKFIDRIRIKFCELFLTLLEKQLILKGIVTPEDWEQIKFYIDFDWAKDNYFSELKEIAVATERFTAISLVMPFIGRFVSNEWVRKKLLFQTDEEFEEINQQIMMERMNPLYQVMTDAMGNPMDDQGLVMPTDDPNIMMAMQDMQADHNDEMQKAQDKHRTEKDKLQDRHDSEKDRLKDKLSDIKARHRELKVKHAATTARRAASSKKK